MLSRKIRLQLYADENFPLTSVTHLRSLGISIVHAYSMGYIQKSDQFHLKTSKKLGRTLITRDRDFSYNWSTLRDHPGVILVSPGSQVSAEVNKICTKAFKKLTPHFVSESLVRISIAKIERNKNGVIEKIDLE